MKGQYQIYALLGVEARSEVRIREFFQSRRIPSRAIKKNLHLTVYHGRRKLPGFSPFEHPVNIAANVLETRFMVMAPGGENPRPDLEPRDRSVGIRLTRRNGAISDLEELRSSVYRFETMRTIGARNFTNARRNAFGARHFQPHITLLGPGSGIDRDLGKLGESFRSAIERIEFDRFEVRC